MTILHLAASMAHTGPPVVILAASKHSVSRGHRVVVASTAGPLVPEAEAVGISWKELPLRRHQLPFGLGVAVRRTLQIIDCEMPEVIVAHARIPAVVGYLCARWKGLPLVTVAHGRYVRGGLLRQLMDSSIGAGDLVIAISHALGQWMVQDKHLASERVRVVQNGIDLDRLNLQEKPQDIRARHRIPLNAAVVGVVSRLVPEKGHIYLLRAFRELVGRFPSARLLIVGDGRHRAYLENWVHRNDLRKHVIFAGEAPGSDLGSLIAAMDIFCFPSPIEAFALVLLEAMALGKPVVASRAGGLPEIVVDGETGLLVEPADPEAIASALSVLLVDPQRAVSLGRAGKERVRRHFSAERMAVQTEEVYREAISRKPSLRPCRA